MMQSFFDLDEELTSGEPIVTLGMPTYNESAYIAETLDSLLAQSFKRFKLIIADNNSTDRTREILESYAAKDSRIELTFHSTNLGAFNNWDYLLQKSDLKYFAWVGPHDIYHPRWLECLVSVLERNKFYILAYPMTEGIDQYNNRLYVQVKMNQTAMVRDKYLCIKNIILNFKSHGNKIYGLYRTPFVKKHPFILCPLWDKIFLVSLSVYGEYMHVPLLLWKRRHIKKDNAIIGYNEYAEIIQRQIKTNYKNGLAPANARLVTFFHCHILLRTIKKRLGLYKTLKIIFFYLWNAKSLLCTEIRLYISFKNFFKKTNNG